MTNFPNNKYKAFIFIIGIFSFVFSNIGFIQIKFTCPLPNAVIQNVGDSAYLRIQCSSNNSKKILLKITDSVGKEILGFGEKKLFFFNDVDTFFVIPLLRKFILKWQTLDGQIDSGAIENLSVGHVFAIAGQSNAQGWSPPPFINPHGDIRMLRNDSAWQKGEDPTGGMYASPWIEFSNKLQELLQDNLPIGLVNAAVGGTGLVNKTASGWWQRNNIFHADSLTVYGKALRKFRSAGGKFEAVFWIQGESDAVGVTGEEYDTAFRQLVVNFEEDLGSPLQLFHLQIGGQNGNPDKIHWGIIREAQRNLPFSTLVNTAVGAPNGFDGIHYAPITEIMVGDRFAGAVAQKLHNISNNLASPLLPQSHALLTACTLNDPYKGNKIVLQCIKEGKIAQLIPIQRVRGFQIRRNGQFIDTSQIFAALESNDLSKIDIFSKDSSFTSQDEIQLSYAITADISNVNVSDNDSSTTLPNFLAAFMDIPVLKSDAGVRSSEFSTQIISNPFIRQSSLHIFLRAPQNIRYTVYSITGQVLCSRNVGILTEGDHVIQLNEGSMASGIYEIIINVGNKFEAYKVISF